MNKNVIFTVDAAAVPPVFNQDDKQQVNGVSLGIAGRILRNWDVMANVAYLDSENESQNVANAGRRLSLTPEFSGSVWTTYTLPIGLTLGGGIRSMDDVFVNAANTIRVPSFHIVDAMATYVVNPTALAAPERLQPDRRGLHPQHQQQRRTLQPGPPADRRPHGQRRLLSPPLPAFLRPGPAWARAPHESCIMLIAVPDVLSADQVAQARQLLETAAWIDGRVTAGPQSARTKDNQQLAEGDPVARQLGDTILAALQRSPLFISAALPLRVFPPLFNRYQGGQSFGSHVDNAIRQVTGTAHRIRTDLSATLFLRNPDEYDGGELLVEDTYGVHGVKLPAGHMVLYPSTSLHSVRPVTRGARVCSFFWIQSMVRDDGRADAAVRSRQRDPASHPRRAGPSLGGAVDRRVPQPDPALGRRLRGGAGER